MEQYKEFGIAPEQAHCLDDSKLPTDKAQQLPDTAAYLQETRDLWSYKNWGNINGIPVDQSDRDLLVDDAKQLNQAMMLIREHKTWTGWISPAQEHKKYVQEYNEIMQQATQGSVFVRQEAKQYSPTKDCFTVVLRYEVLSYRLHPRFVHLRDNHQQG